MIVYRLCSSKYSTVLSDEGARKQSSNRWNSLGTPMIYTSDSPSLCAVELSQHLPPSFVPSSFVLLKIEVPEVPILEVDETFYDDGSWHENTQISQSIGDYFINESDFLVMKVRSAIIASCFNFLINPSHERFSKVKIIERLNFPLKGKLFTKR